jgi:hypothetical protein
MTTILEQFETVCDHGKGDIVCPLCGVNIGQFSTWDYAYDKIASGKCPICDCTLDEGCGEQEWCELCKVPCAERIELDKQWDHVRHLCNEADTRRKYG